MKTRATKVRSTYRKSIKQYVQIFHVIIHKYIVLSVFYCFGFERNVIIYVYPAQNLHDYTCHGRSSLFYYYYFIFLGGGLSRTPMTMYILILQYNYTATVNTMFFSILLMLYKFDWQYHIFSLGTRVSSWCIWWLS